MSVPAIFKIQQRYLHLVWTYFSFILNILSLLLTCLGKKMSFFLCSPNTVVESLHPPPSPEKKWLECKICKINTNHPKQCDETLISHSFILKRYILAAFISSFLFPVKCCVWQYYYLETFSRFAKRFEPWPVLVLCITTDTTGGLHHSHVIHTCSLVMDSACLLVCSCFVLVVVH